VHRQRPLAPRYCARSAEAIAAPTGKLATRA
jgi:hypothetical protein